MPKPWYNGSRTPRALPGSWPEEPRGAAGAGRASEGSHGVQLRGGRDGDCSEKYNLQPKSSIQKEFLLLTAVLRVPSLPGLSFSFLVCFVIYRPTNSIIFILDPDEAKLISSSKAHSGSK